MNIELYERVSLCVDVPEEGLRIGDVATLVDRVPHPEGGESGCVLEVVSAVRESIAVVVVPASSIEPLRADEVLTVRSRPLECAA